MIDILANMSAGFEAAFTLTNLLYICFGVVLGIIFGVLPGMGSVTALAVLIPITFYFSPLSAIAFLVGINKGGTSGGAIPAILINAPGTPEAAATAMDGYPLARQGKPEKAMKTALYASVFGDTFSDIVLILLAAPFAAIALQFGPNEFTTIILFSFTMIAALAGKSLVKGFIAAALGVFLATWGLDPVDSTERMTFGTIYLYDGIPLLPFAIGTLALSSVLSQLYDLRRNRNKPLPQPPTAAELRAGNRLSPVEFWRNWKTLIRSACIGTGVGILPGLGVTLAAFLGYGAARRASPRGEQFGTGEIEGIQATEAANSAVVGAKPDPDHRARNSRQRRSGPANRRLHDSWRGARAIDDGEPRRADLQHFCVHVARQPGPPDHRPHRYSRLGPVCPDPETRGAADRRHAVRRRCLHSDQLDV